MAIFRVEKTQNFTIMSNHHLRSTALSLKAKGLLSQILSLPTNWDYTLMGLSHINRENVDAIRTAIQELEREGYVTRSRERKSTGQLGGTVYTIHEQPPESFAQNNDTTPPILDSPTLEKPILENPTQVNPTQANPTLENPTQLNKDKRITDIVNTDSIPITSVHVQKGKPERKGADAVQSMSAYDIYRDIIKDNIDYEHLLDNYKYDHERIEEIVELMLETICTARTTIRIASDDYPAELVKAKFLKLTGIHIEYVIHCMNKNTADIRNIKKYLLAVLFNAPTTMDNYYTSQVAHDMASGKLHEGDKKT